MFEGQQPGRRCLLRRGLVDGGIRTLSGGQVSIQVDGPLAVQSNAVPQLSVEAPHAVRDVFANVIEPPTGGPIQVRCHA